MRIADEMEAIEAHFVRFVEPFVEQTLEEIHARSSAPHEGWTRVASHQQLDPVSRQIESYPLIQIEEVTQEAVAIDRQDTGCPAPVVQPGPSERAESKPSERAAPALLSAAEKMQMQQPDSPQSKMFKAHGEPAAKVLQGKIISFNLVGGRLEGEGTYPSWHCSWDVQGRQHPVGCRRRSSRAFKSEHGQCR